MIHARAPGLLTPLVCAVLCVTGAWGGERTAQVNYVLRCSGCHGTDGSGDSAAGIPDLRNSVGAFADDDDGRTYVLHVPGVANASLSDREIAAVINYVMQSWGGTSLSVRFVAFTPDEVAARRARPVDDVVRFRREIVGRLHARGISTADYPWP